MPSLSALSSSNTAMVPRPAPQIKSAVHVQIVTQTRLANSRPSPPKPRPVNPAKKMQTVAPDFVTASPKGSAVSNPATKAVVAPPARSANLRQIRTSRVSVNQRRTPAPLSPVQTTKDAVLAKFVIQKPARVSQTFRHVVPNSAIPVNPTQIAMVRAISALDHKAMVNALCPVEKLTFAPKDSHVRGSIPAPPNNAVPQAEAARSHVSKMNTAPQTLPVTTAHVNEKVVESTETHATPCPVSKVSNVSRQSTANTVCNLVASPRDTLADTAPQTSNVKVTHVATQSTHSAPSVSLNAKQTQIAKPKVAGHAAKKEIASVIKIVTVNRVTSAINRQASLVLALANSSTTPVKQALNAVGLTQTNTASPQDLVHALLAKSATHSTAATMDLYVLVQKTAPHALNHAHKTNLASSVVNAIGTAETSLSASVLAQIVLLDALVSHTSMVHTASVRKPPPKVQADASVTQSVHLTTHASQGHVSPNLPNQSPLRSQSSQNPHLSQRRQTQALRPNQSPSKKHLSRRNQKLKRSPRRRLQHKTHCQRFHQVDVTVKQRHKIPPGSGLCGCC